jgi:hypothetical protein
MSAQLDYHIILRECTWLPGSEVGWGCGYVCIPPNHPYHGTDYNDIPVDVHGGLTFGEHASDIEFRNIPSQYYVVGFDTAHCMDTPENCPQSYVQSEAESLQRQLKELANAPNKS